MDFGKTLAVNLKGLSIVENPIFQLVREDKLNNYPIVGSTDPIPKRNHNQKNEEEEEECPSKKSKLTFYEVSDGELSD